MRPLRFGMVAVALGFALVPAPMQAADPFYTNLLETGKSSLERGDFAAAIHALRVASFGLLDEPEVLAVGLTHLALAQAGSGDSAAFDETVVRLLDIERRFSAYQNARMDGTTRQALEQRLVATVPYEQLSRLPAFRVAARARREQDVRSMPPETRRPALEALMAAEPGDLGWRTLLAELELASGRPVEARNALATLTTAQAQDPRVRCLRGRAQAASGACTAALTDLETCGAPASDAALAADWVTCLTATGDWQQAGVVLDSLPAAWRNRKPLRALDRETRRSLKRLAKATPAPVATPTETGLEAGGVTVSPDPTETPIDSPDVAEAVGEMAAELDPPTVDTPSVPAPTSTAPPAMEPSAAQTPPAVPTVAPPAPPAPTTSPAADLERLRNRFVNASDQASLVGLFDEATALADAHRDVVDAQFLAAEVAYRLRRWPDVVHYIQRGDPVTNRPALQFYLAVALFETGDQAAAAIAIKECLPDLAPSEFVQAYADKILGNR